MMKKYCFALNVKYFFDEKNIYFRKGIWNTLDGIVPFDLLDDKEKFFKLLDDLEKSEVDEKYIHQLSKGNTKIFNDLITNNFVIETDATANIIARIFVGNDFIDNKKTQRFDLITDSSIVFESLNMLKNSYKLEYKTLTAENLNVLSDVNFCSKVNSLEYENRMQLGRSFFTEKNPKLILLENLNISICKNINQLINNEPLMIGFIDGPFMIFTTLLKKQTGCWDCFEQRMLANIKDLELYHKFKFIKPKLSSEKTYDLHMINLLHIGLEEIFSWNILQMTKLMGRSFFVFLPTMEFHFHNVDRLSSCSTCGALSVIDYNENNVSLGRILEELL